MDNLPCGQARQCEPALITLATYPRLSHLLYSPPPFLPGVSPEECYWPFSILLGSLQGPAPSPTSRPCQLAPPPDAGPVFWGLFSLRETSFKFGSPPLYGPFHTTPLPEVFGEINLGVILDTQDWVIRIDLTLPYEVKAPWCPADGL